MRWASRIGWISGWMAAGARYCPIWRFFIRRFSDGIHSVTSICHFFFPYSFSVLWRHLNLALTVIGRCHLNVALLLGSGVTLTCPLYGFSNVPPAAVRCHLNPILFSYLFLIRRCHLNMALFTYLQFPGYCFRCLLNLAPLSHYPHGYLILCSVT